MNTALNTVFKAKMNTAVTKQKEDDPKTEKGITRLQVIRRKSEKVKSLFSHSVSFYRKSRVTGFFQKHRNPLCLLGYRHDPGLKKNTLNMVHFLGVNGMVESGKLTNTEYPSATQEASIFLCSRVFRTFETRHFVRPGENYS